MICHTCEGKGIVPSSAHAPASTWDGSERRNGERETDNSELMFAEVVPAARYTACPACFGGGKLHVNLLMA